MNVFVLCTGRCGSTTFIQACKYISNYSSAHESRTGFIYEKRLDYPANHIEADNRLSWFLGKLEKKYGNDACYIHLKRDEIATATSFMERYNSGIMSAYANAIIMNRSNEIAQFDVCLDYLRTVNSNIELFLKHKTMKMVFSLENAKSDFVLFWEMIHAKGNLISALAEWDIFYNQIVKK
jgi:hypothetical protein